MTPVYHNDSQELPRYYVHKYHHQQAVDTDVSRISQDNSKDQGVTSGLSPDTWTTGTSQDNSGDQGELSPALRAYGPRQLPTVPTALLLLSPKRLQCSRITTHHQVKLPMLPNKILEFQILDQSLFTMKKPFTLIRLHLRMPTDRTL